ncbi:hypothetical protein EJ08DRAFT_596662 [Tothia fuscella]|uniref:Uncharacterized protein n=1 Tax=Tothia fuscella TaxID=1048955 RepID=A0A9P4NIC9_9PEZI|nr:hypothetical protein EJ08DRAFT_596662 [Tothia fuscella]
MPHVLSALATLHHNDIVPESVYSDSPTQDASAIQQPPILHLLSSRILGALSDAAWNAHQASTASSKAEPKSKYSILYSELPGTRYKTQAQDLRPEIWLEFVLWSCLHGDWVSDGAAILQSMQEYTDESSWSLISWRQIMENANTVEKGEGTGTQSREHLENGTVYRTVSSELVSAYVDGLINLIDVGVSDQGMPLNVILSRVKGLKALLDQKNFGLGNTTWDATVQRFTESGGIVVENDPESMLEILALVQPYEVERECLNVPTDDLSTHPTPSYTFDSSALCLGLYHRVIQSYIDIGNVDEALATWETLQRFTDLNQQRSIEQFFRHGAQNTAENSTDIMFVSPTGFRNTEYPSFFPRVPYHILTPLINLLTDSRISSFQKWLIHSSDLDGPTISRSVYSEASLAPALIRFAATFGDKELLEEIIKAQSDVMGTEGFRLPRSVLSALIQSQIRRHRWAHVHRLLLTTGEKYDNAVWHPPIVAGLAREIMLLQRNVKAGRTRKENESLAQATEIFQLLYEDTYGPSIKHWGKFEALRVLHSIIGVLSSVNTEWANLCNGLSILSGNQSLSLHIRIFDTILEGVVESLGVEAGRRLWETWCVDLAEEGIRHSGGIAKVPSEFVSRSSDYFDTNKRIVLDDLPGESLSFYGRLKPTFSTLRIIMRQLQLQKNKSGKNDGRATSTKGTMANQPYEDMMKWALAKYQDLGLDEEKVSKEMLRVENWAKLQERLSIEDSVP